MARALEAYLAGHTNYWPLDSPHIWYEEKPFIKEKGVLGYRRYEIGTTDIDDIGVGIIVEVSTAFFSQKTLSYFFSNDVHKSEKEKRFQQFEQLSNRQQGQNATRWYNIKDHKGKCWFKDAPPDITCATTGEIIVDGHSYPSLHAYYTKHYSDYKGSPNDRCVSPLMAIVIRSGCQPRHNHPCDE